MKKILLLSVSLFSMASSNSWAAPTGNQVTSLDGKEVLAFYTREFSQDGDVSVVSTEYKDNNGNLLVSERGESKAGRMYRYEVSHKQLNKTATILLNPDVILFEVTENGKKKSATEQNKGVVLPPLAIVKYIETNLDSLKAKKTLPIRIAVWDRLDTVGMDLDFVEDSPFTKREGYGVIRMKPSSFIISKLVDPLFFEINLNSGKAVQMRGRLPIKKVEGSKVRDLDGILPIE